MRDVLGFDPKCVSEAEVFIDSLSGVAKSVEVCIHKVAHALMRCSTLCVPQTAHSSLALSLNTWPLDAVLVESMQFFRGMALPRHHVHMQSTRVLTTLGTARFLMFVLHHCCLQSAPELRAEAVDYVQQDMTGQPVNQTAETLAILVDATAEVAELLAAKTIIKQVPRTVCSSKMVKPPAISRHLCFENWTAALDHVYCSWLFLSHSLCLYQPYCMLHLDVEAS